MKVTINAFGSRGDVQPFVALGLGLKKAGHEVLLATHHIFESLIRQQELDFFPLEIDPRQVLLTQAVAELGYNSFKTIGWIQEQFRIGLPEIFKETLEAAQGADLLVNSTLSFAGYHIAQKLDITSVAAYLQPATPTKEFASAIGAIPPPWLPFKKIVNYLSTKMTNQFFLQTIRPMSNICRKEILDLPPLPARFYLGLDSPSTLIPILYAYSPAVLPKPPDWGDQQHITGYWFLDQTAGYEPPSELKRFLESGPPPIYIGFGSMVDHEKEAMGEIIIEAVKRSGQRAILLGGWSDLGGDQLPDFILRIDSVPHDWLFPQMATLVHHGGAGTTAAGLRAGVPSVIIPFFADQPFWSWRVEQLGVGVKGIPRKKLTAEKLAQAIRQAVDDPTIRSRAADLGKVIRSENGVEQAVKLIETYAVLKPKWW